MLGEPQKIQCVTGLLHLSEPKVCSLRPFKQGVPVVDSVVV